MYQERFRPFIVVSVGAGREGRGEREGGRPTAMDLLFLHFATRDARAGALVALRPFPDRPTDRPRRRCRLGDRIAVSVSRSARTGGRAGGREWEKELEVGIANFKSSEPQCNITYIHCNITPSRRKGIVHATCNPAAVCLCARVRTLPIARAAGHVIRSMHVGQRFELFFPLPAGGRADGLAGAGRPPKVNGCRI